STDFGWTVTDSWRYSGNGLTSTLSDAATDTHYDFVDFFDIDGDGLSDRLTFLGPSGSQLLVNTGSGWKWERTNFQNLPSIHSQYYTLRCEVTMPQYPGLLFPVSSGCLSVGIPKG